jgi:hypothetical protein
MIRTRGKTWFDRSPVVRAADRADWQALSRFGAFTMTRARQSIRARKKVSAPGDPPSSHVGRYKRLVRFGVDRSTRSVVIGPEPYGDGRAGPLLEYGGESTRTRRGKVSRVTYRARPHMGPAFTEELRRAPDLWAHSVR